MFRGGPFIKTWETFWTDPASGPQAPINVGNSIHCAIKFIDMFFSHKHIRLLEIHLDDGRRLIGDRKSSDFVEVNGDPDLLTFCKWEERVAV